MHTILLLGGGKSATYLIDYLADQAATKNRKFILADLDLEASQKKLNSRPSTEAVVLNANDDALLENLISKADVVISMLPAFLHPKIAKKALALKKHFFSASYESPEMKEIKSEIEEANLFFLNECGLDPGVDHMSAMKIMDEAKERGEKIISFKSFCGGLLSPESEDNPWKYKFTWNPRNVVLAGQGTSRYIEQGVLKFIPYQQLFKRLTPLHFDGLGEYEAYPNRDSLSYREVYGLENIPTILRGTIRRTGFSKAWNVFVQLGMTEDTYQVKLPEGTTFRSFLNTFLPYHPSRPAEEKLGELLPDIDFATWEKIQWLGFFSSDLLEKREGTPAEILKSILLKNWTLDEEDKDLIVMQHQFKFQSEGQTKKITSSLICTGQDSVYTAMAKMVGLPLGIAVDQFLDGNIDARGLHTPVIREIYNPILEKLKEFGITFTEKEEALEGD